MKLGLTGGIGCGKSTALKLFAEHGLRVIETDAIVRDLFAGDDELRAQLRAQFGGKVFDPEGKVDRAELARTVFADSTALTRLESLVHPRVREVWMRALHENTSGIVVEIPLLFEKDLQHHFDATVCIGSDKPVQFARLSARGMSESQIEQRITRQLPVAEKMRRADFQIHNNGTLDHLRQQVAMVLQSLKQ